MLSKTKARELDPIKRATNFEEVSCGYTLDEALKEANRCLQCKNEPCRAACPVNVPIKDFILKVKENDIVGAHKVIANEHLFPSICGRVCPQEKQCEMACIRGIKGEPVGVGLLERFVGDNSKLDIKLEEPNNNIKVAVIGSGPAGMACATDLALAGFSVTMFEALHALGGVLAYGIPEFRLPKDILNESFDTLKSLGVKIEKNVVVGKSVTVSQLKDEGFKATFIATGAGLPKPLGIKNEHINGVVSANGFLTRVNLMKGYLFPAVDTPVWVGRNVAVVGAGNVAMDAARTAKRLGAENVYIVYRRGEEQIPARLEEYHHAKQEGVVFKLLTNPIEVIEKDHYVDGLKCEIMELGEKDASGRRRPLGTNKFVTLDVDMVIPAIGQTSNPTVFEGKEDIKRSKYGTIIVDEETLETSLDNVYAGGDIVTGAATVILAMGSGRLAAKAIKEKLLTK